MGTQGELAGKHDHETTGQSCCSGFGPWQYTISVTTSDDEKHSMYVDGDQVVLGEGHWATVLSVELAEPGAVVLGLPKSPLHVEVVGETLRVTDTGKTLFVIEHVSEGNERIRLRTKEGSYLCASKPGAPISLTAEQGGDTCFSLAPGAPRFVPKWAADEDHPFDPSFNTHLWIFNSAVLLVQGLTHAPRNLAALKLCLGNPDFLQAVKQGIYDADNSGIFDVATSGTAFSAHFYNPDTKRGGAWDTNPKINAVEYGVRYFEQSMQDTDPVSCGRKLGLAIHYLEDLTQPMHCNDFLNLPGTVYPGMRHEEYEKWTLTIQGSCLLNAAELDPNFVPPGNGQWRDWWEYAAQQGLAEYKQWTGPYSPIGFLATKYGSPDWVPFTCRMLKLAQRLVACLLVQWAQVSKLVANIGATVTSHTMTLRRIFVNNGVLELNHYAATAYSNEDSNRGYAHLTGPSPDELWVLEPVLEGGKPVFEGDNPALLIRNKKSNKCILGGDTFDGNIYHQDPAGRLNAQWIVKPALDEKTGKQLYCVPKNKNISYPVWHIVDRKHKKYLYFSRANNTSGPLSHGDSKSGWCQVPADSL